MRMRNCTAHIFINGVSECMLSFSWKACTETVLVFFLIVVSLSSHLPQGYYSNASVIIHSTQGDWRCCFHFRDVNSRTGEDNN